MNGVLEQSPLFENSDIVVRPSSIEGVGMYAKRDFKQGEVVVKWHPIRTVTEKEIEMLPPEEKRCVNPLADGTKVIMGIPERYMNHSCDPSTHPINDADVAIRDIKTGEEITANYFPDGTPPDFICNCGSANCVSKRS